MIKRICLGGYALTLKEKMIRWIISKLSYTTVLIDGPITFIYEQNTKEETNNDGMAFYIYRSTPQISVEIPGYKLVKE